MASISLPSGQKSVTVRMIDTTTTLVVSARSFIEPVQAGHEFLNITAVAFLIEHGPSGRKILFDLGVRKDYWNYAAVMQKRLGAVIPGLRVDKGVPDTLTENGIPLSSISSVIWSHYHWDHVGDMSLFPSSTELVVGPGFQKSSHLLPGYPKKGGSPLLESDFAGRELREVDFTTSNLEIGGFPAFDFFGDGSFYLLDTPGHCLGHMCGLARTTPDPDSTFAFLGGDICHFAGDFRPSATHPIPDVIPIDVLDADTFFPVPCPCHIFTDHHPLITTKQTSKETRTSPFYKVSTNKASAYTDPTVAQLSVNKLMGFDAAPEVFICLTHDPALLKYVPTFNTDSSSAINDWKSMGWKEKCRWEWLNELPRGGTPGRKPIVEGFWRNGKFWEDGREELLRLGSQATSVDL